MFLVLWHETFEFASLPPLLLICPDHSRLSGMKEAREKVDNDENRKMKENRLNKTCLKNTKVKIIKPGEE